MHLVTDVYWDKYQPTASHCHAGCERKVGVIADIADVSTECVRRILNAHLSTHTKIEQLFGASCECMHWNENGNKLYSSNFSKTL